CNGAGIGDHDHPRRFVIARDDRGGARCRCLWRRPAKAVAHRIAPQLARGRLDDSLALRRVDGRRAREDVGARRGRVGSELRKDSHQNATITASPSAPAPPAPVALPPPLSFDPPPPPPPPGAPPAPPGELPATG